MIKIRSITQAILGISIEVAYTLAIILSAYLVCLALSYKSLFLK